MHAPYRVFQVLSAACALCWSTSASAAESTLKLRLAPPIISGYGIAFNDPRGELESSPQSALLGTGMEVDFGRSWAAEVRADVVMDSVLPRIVTALRAGPRVTLWDERGAARTGMVLELMGMAGLGYRSQKYNWIHGNTWEGQQILTVDVVPALDLCGYFTPTFGWNIRVRAEGSLGIVREGPAVFYNGDSGDDYDGYRGGAIVGLDAGIVL